MFRRIIISIIGFHVFILCFQLYFLNKNTIHIYICKAIIFHGRRRDSNRDGDTDSNSEKKQSEKIYVLTLHVKPILSNMNLNLHFIFYFVSSYHFKL